MNTNRKPVPNDADNALNQAIHAAMAQPSPTDAKTRVLEKAVALSDHRNSLAAKTSDAITNHDERRMADDFVDFAGRVERSEPHRPDRLTFVTHSLANWRWIVRHPLSRVTAAAILFLAISGVVLWLHGSGTSAALADFIQPILDAKTITFKCKTVEIGVAAVGYSKVMVMTPNRVRMEIKIPDRSFNKTQITINDQEHHKMKQLVLIPDDKKAIFFDFYEVPDFKFAQTAYAPFLFLVEIRSQWLNGGDNPKIHRESLGEKDIDGCKAIGYRFVSPDATVTLWGNPKTGVPIQIVREWKIPNKARRTGTETFSDIVLNADLDKSLFDLTVPNGYTAETKTVSLKARDR